MKLPDIGINWFDFVVLVMVAVGVYRGRSRGMSEELLDVLKWLVIVVVGGLIYRPVGLLLVDTIPFFNVAAAYLLVYIALIIAVRFLFGWIKQMSGEKLVGSDVFGSWEYYLGMLGGAVRFVCYLIVALALLNAKYVSAEQLAAEARLQQDNFGDISFPTLGSIQQEVFHRSFSGAWIKQHMAQELIATTDADRNRTPYETVGRQREREADEVLMDKK
jgi:uncharacterized membrane protein required for colicin V production